MLLFFLFSKLNWSRIQLHANVVSKISHVENILLKNLSYVLLFMFWFLLCSFSESFIAISSSSLRTIAWKRSSKLIHQIVYCLSYRNQFQCIQSVEQSINELITFIQSLVWQKKDLFCLKINVYFEWFRIQEVFAYNWICAMKRIWKDYHRTKSYHQKMFLPKKFLNLSKRIFVKNMDHYLHL